MPLPYLCNIKSNEMYNLKNKIIMKALVLSVVFALTSVVNAVSGNNVKDFAYNSEKQENGVETQTVYKVKEGKYLERHLQYNYTHDEKGRVSAKEILKWNQDNSRFEKLYCLNFSYTDNEVNVEYVAWNSKAGDYTNVKVKAVYQMNENGMNYMAYNWNEKENSWNLVTEHNATHWSSVLLAKTGLDLVNPFMLWNLT